MMWLVGLIASRTGASRAASGALLVLVLVVALVAAFWLYGRSEYRSGYSDGVAFMKELNAQADADQSKEREKIDEEVNNLGDRDLCVALGGGVHCD